MLSVSLCHAGLPREEHIVWLAQSWYDADSFGGIYENNTGCRFSAKKGLS
jgi:hypothetical protein